MLQSLVRNTRGNDSGEARLDPEHKRGFGAVDLGKLLSVDPTVYPDVNPLLEWAVKASGEHEETKGMYTDSYSDLKDEYTSRLGDVFSPEGEQIECSKACGLIGKEARRERKAWERVEQCRKDGGSDCMRYSATATADEADREAGWDDVKADYGRGGVSKSSSKSSLPSWFVPAVVGGSVLLVVLLVGGVVLAVVFLSRRRRGSHAGSGPVPGGGPAPVPGGVPPMPPAPSAPPMTGTPSAASFTAVPGAPYAGMSKQPASSSVQKPSLPPRQ